MIGQTAVYVYVKMSEAAAGGFGKPVVIGKMQRIGLEGKTHTGGGEGLAVEVLIADVSLCRSRW